MSENEAKKIDELNAKIDRLFLVVEGEPKQGIEGLVPMLQRHMKESKDSFKTFKRDIALEYVNDINYLSERLKPLEKADKMRYKNLGIFSGVGFVVGNFCWFLYEHLKTFFDFFSGK